VLYQAQVMMEMALAMRNYTSEQVKPVVNELQKTGDLAQTDGGDRSAAARVFRPQTVPAFAASEIFNYLRKRYPDYFYKEAALNPTNPRNRAAEWEEDIIKVFRNHPELQIFHGERSTPFGRALYLARPMRASRACLECHSTPAAAPPEMVQLYGPANGFGWTEQDVIAAQIVSVPVSVPSDAADQAFRRLIISLVAVAAATLLVLNLALYLTVIRPVVRFAALADHVSRGDLDVPELPVRGKDEISVIAAAFNRMRRALAAVTGTSEKP
jgi:protein-histidine pros-kinase